MIINKSSPGSQFNYFFCSSTSAKPGSLCFKSVKSLKYFVVMLCCKALQEIFRSDARKNPCLLCLSGHGMEGMDFFSIAPLIFQKKFV